MDGAELVMVLPFFFISFGNYQQQDHLTVEDK